MFSRITTLFGVWTLFLVATLWATEPTEKYGEIPSITAYHGGRLYYVGDIITLKLTVLHNKNQSLLMPDIGEKTVEPFNLLNYKVENPVVSDKGEIVTNTVLFRFYLFKTGVYSIKPIQVEIREDEKHTLLSTPPITIEISSLLTDPQKQGLEDIKPIQEVSYLWPLLIYAVLFTFLGFLFYYLIHFLIQRRKKALPVYVVTSYEIQNLLKRRYVETGRYKFFFYDFTQIIKNYLEKVFGRNYTSMSTEEVRDALEKDSSAHAAELLQVFSYADKVKFANKEAKNEDIEQFLGIVRTILDEHAQQEKVQKIPNRKGNHA